MSLHGLAMRDAYLESVWREMSNNRLIFFLSADFGSPVLDKIRRDFPDRFLNVGIAEQNLINVAAGLAIEGHTVFAYAIAPFITMRCYEQLRVNMSLLSEVRPMNVNLIGVGVGYSYVVSGPTHQCYEDVSIMRALPNFQILSPADHIAASALFDQHVNSVGLKYFRFDAQPLPAVYADPSLVSADGFCVHRRGEKVCLIASGFMLHTSLEVSNELESNSQKIGVIDIFNLTNFASESLAKALESYDVVVSCEEGFRDRGGLDALISSVVSEYGLSLKILKIGVNPGYSFDIGSRFELHQKAGIGKSSILEEITPLLEKGRGS